MTTFVLKKKKKKTGAWRVPDPDHWKTKLKDLTDMYVGLQLREMELKREYNDLFVELEKLGTDKEELKIQIQDIARKQSKQGQTLTLLDTDYVKVHVSGNQSGVKYDLAKASKYWSPKILSEVLEINAKRVEELLSDGTLPDSLAERAALPREAKTAAVTIKIKNDGRK